MKLIDLRVVTSSSCSIFYVNFSTTCVKWSLILPNSVKDIFFWTRA